MASLRGILLLTTLLLNSAVQADDRLCYYPNGVESGDVPCSSSDETHCCGPYGICLENGFCINTSGKPYTLSRGSCTDPDWGASCPTQCTDSPYDGTGVTIGLLTEVIGSWSSYCCGHPEIDGDELVCPSNLTSFTIEHGDMIYGYAGLANATEISSTSSVSSQTGSADSACATSSSGSSDGSSSGTGGSDAAVGAGVGVSLGAALVGALAWGFWERRKRLQERRAAGGMPGMPGMGPTEPKPLYAGYSNTPRAPYPSQPPQAYSPQLYYPPQPAYAPQAAQVPPLVPGELPHHSPGAVEMMDNPRQH